MSTFTTADAESRGISRSTLSRAVSDGRVERIARGIYRTTSSAPADLDQIEAVTRRPEATICLESALAHHGLTDEIPSRLHVAMYRGGRIPASSSSIAWHTFDPASFELGRSISEIQGTDLTIGVHCPERAIADAFRLRGSHGYELGTEALKAWLAAGGKPADLARMALQLPRAKQPLLDALGLLA